MPTSEKLIVSIVGSEEVKFTPLGKERARQKIADILHDPNIIEVVSGECHLGGIDIWTKEIANTLGIKFTGFPPKNKYWETGYKPRNLQMANYSDVVHCITVNKLPETFTGMKFDYCYHCHTSDHIKSGGCWTMKQAKKGILHVIDNGR